ncbi:hypothetical protein [Streptomyces sp. NBC_01717]|uniref:hypothetical protein n=1 Tax=Streptomyces sp. NBC_01717 TaxID=2975918 RepID=UPI003FCE7D88
MNDASPVIDPEGTPLRGTRSTPRRPGCPTASQEIPSMCDGWTTKWRPLEAGENWLVLYRSQDVRSKEVATSGIIALPGRHERPVPEGGYPLISWAHGTVRVASSVAPSREPAGAGSTPPPPAW